MQLSPDSYSLYNLYNITYWEVVLSQVCNLYMVTVIGKEEYWKRMAWLGIIPGNSSQELYNRATQADIHDPYSPNYYCYVWNTHVSNFTNESLKNCFDACQKMQLKSILIKIHFLKIWQKNRYRILIKICLVFNEIYRGKKQH